MTERLAFLIYKIKGLSHVTSGFSVCNINDTEGSGWFFLSLAFVLLGLFANPPHAPLNPLGASEMLKEVKDLSKQNGLFFSLTVIYMASAPQIPQPAHL